MTPPPVNPSHDRALLFALLAHQMSFIDRAALVETLNAWSLDKSRNIADLLVERGHLTPDARALLEGLANHQEAVHGGAVGGLEALSHSGSTFDEIATRIPDPELLASFQHVLTRTPDPDDDRADAPTTNDLEVTRSYDNRAITGDHGLTIRTTTVSGHRYHSLQFHAKGGLGVVFKALDDEIHRKVALKEIQDRHADDPANRTRFVREAEITGQLEHPGIVPVYGLGTYANGRPFYAMRFIKGDSLKEAIRCYHEQPDPDPSRRAVELRGLLRRFLDVCNAIDYAHARGVLHRDLKPGNVMVGKYGETLVVDWGLARILDRTKDDAPTHLADEETIYPSGSRDAAQTVQGKMLGTVGYMSPEQATGRLDELGPASDVYSLGAILYTLLTGHPTIRSGTLDEVQARVQKGDFPSPRHLVAEIPRPLDAICLKALSIAPPARYPSARALATDLERWLADEPVAALPDLPLDHLARWTRRHKQATVSASLSMVIVTAIAVTSSFVVDFARRKTAAALEAEKLAKSEADTNFQRALRTVDDLLTAVSESKELQVLPNTQAFRRTLLVKARDYYQDFLESRSTDSAVKTESGLAFFRLASVEQEIGSKENAVHFYKEAVRILDPMDRDNPRAAGYQDGLARALTGLGNLQQSTGRGSEAERSYTRAVETYQAVVRDNPKVTGYQDGLAGVLTSFGVLQETTGRLAEAERLYARAAGLYETLVRDKPEIARYQNTLSLTLTNLGNLQNATDRALEAERSYARAVEVSEIVARENPKVAEYQAGLALVLTNLGNLQLALGRGTEAGRAYDRAVEVSEVVARENPKVAGYQDVLARALSNLGRLQHATGRGADAERSYARAVELYEALARDNSTFVSYQSDLASVLMNLGNIQNVNGRKPEAERSYAHSIVILEVLIRENPKIEGYQDLLANALTNLGILQRAMGRSPEAGRSYGRAIAIREALARENPKVTGNQYGLARVLNNLGALQRTTGLLVDAERSLAHAVEAYQPLLVQNPQNADLRSGLGAALNNLADLLAATSRHEEAVVLYRRAIALQREARASNPRNPTYRMSLSEHHRGLSEVLRTLRRSSEAAEATRERAKLWPGVAGQQYAIACELALCIPLTSGREEARLGDEAMGALLAAVAAGWNKAEHTARDPDLVPLHGRVDFQELLQSLQDRVFPVDPFARGK